eukprot:scaffold20778_cov69-Phaeocystis_antarctica.AAC.4
MELWRAVVSGGGERRRRAGGGVYLRRAQADVPSDPSARIQSHPGVLTADNTAPNTGGDSKNGCRATRYSSCAVASSTGTTPAKRQRTCASRPSRTVCWWSSSRQKSCSLGDQQTV